MVFLFPVGRPGGNRSGKPQSGEEGPRCPCSAFPGWLYLPCLGVNLEVVGGRGGRGQKREFPGLP